MNKLHIALLSASMIFSASVFCSQTPAGTPPTGTNAAGTPPAGTPETPGSLKQASNFAKAVFLFPVATAPQAVSKFLKINTVIEYALSASFLGGKEGRLAKATPVIGGGVVLATAVALLYVAYNKFIAEQNADTDNEDFFVPEDETTE